MSLICTPWGAGDPLPQRLHRKRSLKKKKKKKKKKPARREQRRVCRWGHTSPARPPGRPRHRGPARGPDGVPMHAQQARHLLVLVGRSTRQQGEHLQAGLFVPVVFMLQALLEGGDLLRASLGRDYASDTLQVGRFIVVLEDTNPMHNCKSDFISDQVSRL